jgi:hypothetical protein
MGARLGLAQGTQGQQRGEEGGRRQASADLLTEDGGFDHSHAKTALVFGNFQSQPPLIGHGCPHGAIESRWRIVAWGRCFGSGPRQGTDNDPITNSGPQRVMVGKAIQKRSGSITKCLLIGGEIEVHGGAV